MSMPDTKHILTLADRYCEISGLSRSRISTLIFNDGQTLKKIQNGADITLSRYAKALQWFSDNWPAKPAWPREIPRPVPSYQAA